MSRGLSSTVQIPAPHISVHLQYIMTSPNGNVFRVTVPLWGEIHRSPVDSPHKGQRRRGFMGFLWSAPEQTVEQIIETPGFETQSRPLWRHCNDAGLLFIRPFNEISIKIYHLSFAKMHLKCLQLGGYCLGFINHNDAHTTLRVFIIIQRNHGHACSVRDKMELPAFNSLTPGRFQWNIR